MQTKRHQDARSKCGPKDTKNTQEKKENKLITGDCVMYARQLPSQLETYGGTVPISRQSDNQFVNSYGVTLSFKKHPLHFRYARVALGPLVTTV